MAGPCQYHHGPAGAVKCLEFFCLNFLLNMHISRHTRVKRASTAVGIVTTVIDRWPENRGWIPGRGKLLSSFSQNPDPLSGPPNLHVQAMKARGEVEDIAPTILNLGIWLGWVVSFISKQGELQNIKLRERSFTNLKRMGNNRILKSTLYYKLDEN